jgi:hypothetical protein
VKTEDIRYATLLLIQAGLTSTGSRPTHYSTSIGPPPLVELARALPLGEPPFAFVSLECESVIQIVWTIIIFEV